MYMYNTFLIGWVAIQYHWTFDSLTCRKYYSGTSPVISSRIPLRVVPQELMSATYTLGGSCALAFPKTCVLKHGHG